MIAFRPAVAAVWLLLAATTSSTAGTPPTEGGQGVAVPASSADASSMARSLPLQIVAAEATGARYLHYPSMAASPDGRLHLVYYHGSNHGQAEVEAVTRAAVHAPGPLPINGLRAVKGVVRPPSATRAYARAAASVRGAVRVLGTDTSGAAIEAEVEINSAGGSGSLRFGSITGAVLEAAGPVKVALGLYMAPSTIRYRFSDDGGATWSDPVVLASDDTGHFNYNGVVGVAGNGDVVVLWTRAKIDSGESGETVEVVRQVSTTNGGSWLPQPRTVSFGDDGPERAPAIYGRLAGTPEGTLVGSVYVGERNWTVASADSGETWTARPLPPPLSVDLSEVTLAILDERRWIAVARTYGVGAHPLRQLMTLDAGRTWTDQGELPLPRGAYVSPDLQVLKTAGGPVLMLTAVTRNDSGPAAADSLIVLYASALDALEAAADIPASHKWSGEHVLVSGAMVGRSGYPAVVVRPDGEGVFIVGREDLSDAPFDPRISRLEGIKWAVQANAPNGRGASSGDRTGGM